ncbi:hypothetical protein PRZ48_012759 [Zasmidium cellare]|uniref:Uncharacterized protein n=1 Tax=Zasmidium cellare TaxID=395010 RepID=A0ABR0E6D3_ZASCE|nr:hypothetical protein PRZ48_012759 [Zasmidium cellare]
MECAPGGLANVSATQDGVVTTAASWMFSLRNETTGTIARRRVSLRRNAFENTLRRMLTLQGISSWGCKIIQDVHDKNFYHAFIAEFDNHCGLDYWSPYSRIIRAESRGSPDGPYTFKEQVIEHFAHNPTVIYSPADQSYLMYYIGCPQPNVNETCTSPRFTCGPGNYINGESGISVQKSKNLRNWEFVGQVVKGKDDTSWNADITNPSPWPLCDGPHKSGGGWPWSWGWGKPQCKDSSILLAYRGCPNNCSGAEQISLALAPHFGGPYTHLNSDSPIFTNDGGSEDPFIWQDKRGNYHILVHSLEPEGGFGSGPKVGRHAFSRSIEGPWRFGNKTLAFSTMVEFEDGTQIDYYRRERPQLFFSDDGEMRPLFLTTGVQEVGSGMSYTLMVPVGDQRGW